MHETILAVVDRAADTAQIGIALNAEPEFDAVWLGQVPIEGPEAVPDVDDLRVVRGDDPIDDPETLQAWVGPAVVAVIEQEPVGFLLEIDVHLRRRQRNDVKMRDIEYRTARRWLTVASPAIGVHC